MQSKQIPWEVTKKLVEVRNPWLCLVGEMVVDDTGKTLDYWRVERDDSIIIIPFIDNHFILPAPFYRHGIGEFTWDFPGGRLLPGHDPQAAIPVILARELGLPMTSLEKVAALNQQDI